MISKNEIDDMTEHFNALINYLAHKFQGMERSPVGADVSQAIINVRQGYMWTLSAMQTQDQLPELAAQAAEQAHADGTVLFPGANNGPLGEG